MSPDLPEKLLGISIDEPSEQRSPDDDGEDEEYVRFVFLALGELRLAVAVDDVRTITDPPAELTRVPRSPPAIEGVTDLRGEITAVIDPRVHFPVEADPADRQQLLVFDRPSDRQAGAVRVDEVLGVETVPESDVIEADELERRDASGGALEHPLVVAVVRQEYARDVDVGEAIGRDAGDGASAGAPVSTAGGAGDRTDGPAGGVRSPTGRRPVDPGATDHEAFDGGVGDEFDAAETDRRNGDEGDGDGDSLVETTALVDVDRLLRASGRTTA